RRSRPVSPPVVIGPRYTDESGGFVRRRRPGLRAGLWRLSRGARAARRQRSSVLDRSSTGGRALRSVRDVSGAPAVAEQTARRRAKIGAADVGRGVDPRSAVAPRARPADLTGQNVFILRDLAVDSPESSGRTGPTAPRASGRSC